MPNIRHQNAADCDSDHPESTPDYVLAGDQADYSNQKKRSGSDYDEDFPPKAGPHSKPFFETSDTPALSPRSNVPPSNKIRGTEKQMKDFFADRVLREVGDPELFRDMSVLFPPPQPAVAYSAVDWEPRPFWGLEPEDMMFFDPEYKERLQLPETVHQTVERFHHLKRKGTHFNQSLMENRSFNNPHVYSQLVEFLGIDETRSNFTSLDTGRKAGSWRAKFPFSEEDLIRGDPIAAEQRQDREASDKKAAADRARRHRTSIDFQKGRHDDGSKSAGKRRSSNSHSGSQKRLR
ncbi:SAP30-binding protein [Kalmanozyma brasiliensis GHG001]|uniref:HCNGP-domain-containing protein n=1 Tax=Kalmanozyma brasiliensis (strain GHG001) TaxID=1365824 RepID=V5F3H5_KALBG|nr:SAP30-binding protein [Kalmanozyma brasiliensis GHG001]EST10054.1 SAP30-binding protein [Kalmanozyma brasiliensis GHG001]